MEHAESAVVATIQWVKLALGGGVVAMGLKLWAAREEIASACVTSVRLPVDADNKVVRDLVRERYGVMLSHGQGAGNLIRIAHMGLTASGLYPIVGLSALGRTLADIGYSVDIGAGIDTALAVLSAQRQ